MSDSEKFFIEGRDMMCIHQAGTQIVRGQDGRLWMALLFDAHRNGDVELGAPHEPAQAELSRTVYLMNPGEVANLVAWGAVPWLVTGHGKRFTKTVRQHMRYINDLIDAHPEIVEQGVAPMDASAWNAPPDEDVIGGYL